MKRGSHQSESAKTAISESLNKIKQKRSEKIKKLWKEQRYNNRDQSYRTEDWKKKVKETLKKLWRLGILNTKSRSNKISKAHKGKYFGKRGRKDYIHICIVCGNKFITKTQHRTVCDREECRKKYPLLKKINPITELRRKKLISKKLKGKMPKNLQRNIKLKLSPPQKKMYNNIKKEFPNAKYNYYLKTNQTKRFLDVAIVNLKLDFEYDGKIHLSSKIKLNDKKRDKEIQQMGWKVYRFNNKNINTLSNVLLKIQQNGDVE